MSVRKVQNRGGLAKSTQRDATATEAAHIMQSYLVEHNFTRTLTEFRSEAAEILSLYRKGAETPHVVKSLSTVLCDYVALSNELRASREANRDLQRALKKGAGALHGLSQFYGKIADFQAGCPPHSHPAPHPLSTPETQPPRPTVSVGPPLSCLQIPAGLNKSPGSAVLAHTQVPLKRKSSVAVKSVQGSTTEYSPEAPAAEKKACKRVVSPSGLPKSRWSTPSPASGPTCPRVSRKSNVVRNATLNAPAKVLFDEGEGFANSPTTNPPLKLLNLPLPEAKSSSRDAPALTKHTREGPQTPPQSSPEEHFPGNRCSADDSAIPLKDGTATGSAESVASPSPDLQAEEDDECVIIKDSSWDQPSPNCCATVAKRVTKLSKTIRPLGFVSSTSSSLSSADPVTGSMEEENMPDLSADPLPIDDILNLLNDDHDLDLLGEMLDNSGCAEDILLSTAGDSVRSPIREDSFGSDCL